MSRADRFGFRLTILSRSLVASDAVRSGSRPAVDRLAGRTGQPAAPNRAARPAKSGTLPTARRGPIAMRRCVRNKRAGQRGRRMVEVSQSSRGSRRVGRNGGRVAPARVDRLTAPLRRPAHARPATAAAWPGVAAVGRTLSARGRAEASRARVSQRP